MPMSDEEYNEWLMGAKGPRNRSHAPVIINFQGYVMLYKPGHPRAQKSGYVLEHIVMWESANNACLLPWSVIVHKNRMKRDNNPKNLKAVVWSYVKHLRHK